MSDLLLLVDMRLDVTLPVCRVTKLALPVCRASSLPVSGGTEEPVACHNKPCYWSPEPFKPEIQVSVTDGHHCFLGRVEKARGWIEWSLQVTCSDDLNRRQKSMKQQSRWPS